jgi:hypothetical protein
MHGGGPASGLNVVLQYVTVVGLCLSGTPCMCVKATCVSVLQIVTGGQV